MTGRMGEKDTVFIERAHKQVLTVKKNSSFHEEDSPLTDKLVSSAYISTGLSWAQHLVQMRSASGWQCHARFMLHCDLEVG